MVVHLPLFKLASLFVRHISKYGANQIKRQAHEHPRVRQFAASYGQIIHQLNMRLSVAVLRDADAEAKAREKAETPTVKTKEQVQKEEEMRAKYGTTAKDSHPSKEAPGSVWRRKFRPLPEAKAVDLFAEVAGDSFILLVAGGLIIVEYYRSAKKPDTTQERIKELETKLEEMKTKEQELEDSEKKAHARVQLIEDALRAYKDPKTHQPLLVAPTPGL